MYRVIREKNGRVEEVVFASKYPSETKNYLISYVLSIATNEVNISDLRSELKHKIVGTTIKIDKVEKLTDEEIVERGGGVCAHCHSADTNNIDLSNEKRGKGFLIKTFTCEACGENTEEYYALTIPMKKQDLQKDK